MFASLSGKNVLITGAAGGIGSETARVCASLGADLVLADVNAPDALAHEVHSAFGTSVRPVALDVRDRAQNEALIHACTRLDAVVANAGICPWDEWDAPDWDAVFQQVIDVNVLGVIHLLRPAMQKMMVQGAGKIVLVSSIAARMGGINASAHYVASKGGILALLKWLARKGAVHGINVNGVAPGPTATAMTQTTTFDVSGLPLGRMANAREIALPIAFLCSAGSDYMCGAMLDVNGGAWIG